MLVEKGTYSKELETREPRHRCRTYPNEARVLALRCRIENFYDQAAHQLHHRHLNQAPGVTMLALDKKLNENELIFFYRTSREDEIVN